MPAVPVDRAAAIERALRSLEGLSVGDAFGEQFLAQPVGILERLERREVLDGPWPYTDDTVMAMSIVETLHHHGHIDQDALAQRFGRKFALDPWRGYGGTAHEILSHFARGQDWRRVARAVFGGAGSMGNGGAMRAGPLGAYFAGDPDTAASEGRLSAEVTHAHPEGQAGAMAVAAAAAWIAGRPSEPGGMFGAVLDVVPAGETRDGIEKVSRLGRDTAVDAVVALVGNGSRVLAQDTVPFALWCAYHSIDDYAGALWTAVSRFGDCDTLGAIVGGIVALGQSAIPVDWRQRREPLATMLRLGTGP